MQNRRNLQSHKSQRLTRTAYLALALAIAVVIGLAVTLGGCGSDNETTQPRVADAIPSGIQAPGTDRPIGEARLGEKAGGSGQVSSGALHNIAMTEFEKTYDFNLQQKATSGTEYVATLVNSMNSALAASGETVRVDADDIYDCYGVLFDLWDQTGVCVFDGEISSPSAVASFFQANGTLNAQEAEWVEGYLDLVASATNTLDLQIAIAQYGMEHGLPYPDTALGQAFNVGMASLLFWGDSKRFSWSTFGRGACDFVGGLGGAYIGGALIPGGPWGGRIGGGLGALAGSTAFMVVEDIISDLRR